MEFFFFLKSGDWVLFSFFKVQIELFFEKEKIEFFFFFGKVHMKLHKYIFLLRPVTLFYLAGAVL